MGGALLDAQFIYSVWHVFTEHLLCVTYALLRI